MYKIISPPDSFKSLEELFAFLDKKGCRTNQLDLLMWFDQNRDLQYEGKAPYRITALIPTDEGYPVWAYNPEIDMASIRHVKESDLLKERHFLIKTSESA